LELATGPIQVTDTPERRALVLGLLERARQNNAMHVPGGAPFTIKSTFDSNGQSVYTGSGEMEETWISGGKWRWTARLGDYSQLRIFYQGLPYDEKSPGPAPLRLQMARSAIFWPVVGNFAAAGLRLTSGQWDGQDVMCILRSDSGDSTEENVSGKGRRWEEAEYCIDPKSGLLRTYSDAPGIYTVFDYAETLHFHGRSLARRITVVEGGNTILRIHLDSIEDPNMSDASLFVPTPQMIAHGPGAFMMDRVHFPQSAPALAGHPGEVQPVVVIASLDKDGKVLEAEVLQNSDSSLSDAALALVKRSTYAPAQSRMPTQRTAFIEVRFGARN
jgi:hypothetical protein